MNIVPTLSDTKRRFYAQHTRPIGSIYRRFLEELMVEMHLLWVNSTFKYDAIYALGVVTSFDLFMDGYQPEQDKTSIFEALCTAVDARAEQYRQDAAQLKEDCTQLTSSDLLNLLKLEGETLPDCRLTALLREIRANETFKYSRLFTVGLLTLIGYGDEALLKDKDQLNGLVDGMSKRLELPAEKMKKDMEMYLSNLEKMGQARLLMDEMVQTERKRREQRALDKQQRERDAQAMESDGEVLDAQTEEQTTSL